MNKLKIASFIISDNQSYRYLHQPLKTYQLIILFTDVNLTFLQACYFDWEARGRDVLHSHLPLSTAFPQFLVLHAERLDGESAVPTRDPRHIGWGLCGHGDSGSVWSFWSWKDKKKKRLSMKQQILVGRVCMHAHCTFTNTNTTHLL